MTQHVPEERLALYVTDDLDAGEIARVRKHLETCADCREAAAALEEICLMLGGIAGEPEPEDLTGVRSRVLSRLNHGRRKVWGWAAAAAAVVALIGFSEYCNEPEPSLPAPPQVAAIPLVSSAFTASSPSAGNWRERRLQAERPAQPGIKAVALISQPKGPPLIKISTTDPHVLILLASDERIRTE